MKTPKEKLEIFIHDIIAAEFSTYHEMDVSISKDQETFWIYKVHSKLLDCLLNDLGAEYEDEGVTLQKEWKTKMLS